MTDKPGCDCHHSDEDWCSVELQAEYGCPGCGRAFGVVDAVPADEIEELVEEWEECAERSGPETFGHVAYEECVRQLTELINEHKHD